MVAGFTTTCAIREKIAHMLFHIMVKLKVLPGFCSTFVLLVGEKIITHLFIQNVLKIVHFKVID
jgi:hypothetical protein